MNTFLMWRERESREGEMEETEADKEHGGKEEIKRSKSCGCEEACC